MEAGWIEEGSRNALCPDRVRQTFTSLAAKWPADAPPLRDVVGGFPLGAQVLFHLISVSPASAGRLIADPAALPWLAQPEISTIERGPKRMRATVDAFRGESAGFDSRFRALRMAKGREMLRIALREVAGAATLEQTTLELTRLAEVCLGEVYRGWLDEFSRRWGAPETDFAILAMGKFGGEELNYSSDIDVIFFYGEEGFLNPGFSRQEFFTRLSEKIISAFQAADEGGGLFRIDLRLRPEGVSGPLVRSLESMENYYAGFGETWERMALIKARGVCASEELAYEFTHRLQPFIYPRILSTDLLDEIAGVKTRIEREIVGHEELRRNIKLGYGGIREIEFVTQTLQILHGSRNAFLHERNTLKALRGLQKLDLIPREDMGALMEAYRFLRTVEHRLQIEREAQTHTLPDDPEAIARMAASLGFPAAEEFTARLERHTGQVRAIFDKVVRSGAGERAADQGADAGFFADAAHARKDLDQLSSGGTSMHLAPRTRRLFAKLEPLLLGRLKEVADPDLALTRFVRFVERYGIRGLLFETLVVNPKLLELLCRLFDSSGYVTGIVLRRPQIVDEMARRGPIDRAHGVTENLEALGRNEERLPWMDWLRVYRRGQLVRILLRDLLGIGTLEELFAEHSALADACVIYAQRALGIENELTVVALGKFGGSELSYGCDLDLIFVGEKIAAAEALIRAMTLNTDEGSVFPVDSRLRPEGESGLLAQPLSAYEAYFQGRAQMWEAQALTKARPVCGPLAGEFAAFARRAWRRFGEQPDVIEQVRKMHRRVVQERSQTEDLPSFKTGVGGLMELEFLVQALQMKHGIWENNCLRAIEALGAGKILSPETAAALRRDYLFLRRSESVLRRVENSSVSVLPEEPSEQAKLAKRMGYAGVEGFWEDYRKARAEIHCLAVNCWG